MTGPMTHVGGVCRTRGNDWTSPAMGRPRSQPGRRARRWIPPQSRVSFAFVACSGGKSEPPSTTISTIEGDGRRRDPTGAGTLR